MLPTPKIEDQPLLDLIKQLSTKTEYDCTNTIVEERHILKCSGLHVSERQKTLRKRDGKKHHETMPRDNFSMEVEPPKSAPKKPKNKAVVQKFVRGINCVLCKWLFPEKFTNEDKDIHENRCENGFGEADRRLWKVNGSDVEQYRNLHLTTLLKAKKLLKVEKKDDPNKKAKTHTMPTNDTGSTPLKLESEEMWLEGEIVKKVKLNTTNPHFINRPTAQSKHALIPLGEKSQFNPSSNFAEMLRKKENNQLVIMPK